MDIEQVPVLVAIGVTETGHKLVLGLQSGDKESASNWRESFKDLKTRGLNKRAVTLDIMDVCLTFFNFTEEEWISLRTTNIIERLNKEFKRRTKPMEIVAGENACYTLLSFICIKMELHWRSNPLGKVRNNLPCFKKMPHENFTQKNLTLPQKQIQSKLLFFKNFANII